MRKTNRYIKYIKCFSIMIVTLLLSFTIATQGVHAVEIDTELQFDKVLYQLYKHDPNTQMDYFDIYLQIPSMYDNYSRNLQDISLGFAGQQDDRIYVFNPNYLVELYRGDLIDRVYYDSIGHVSLLYVTYDAADYYFTFYDENHELLTSFKPFDLPYDDLFLHTSYINQNATIENAFESGRQQGFDEGKRVGDREGYERGFESARDLFAYYDTVNDDYIAATNWGVTEYNRGLNEGLQSTEGAAYDQGYIDGSEDSFMASIKDWIVPAIIIVLFLGGALTIIAKKREA